MMATPLSTRIRLKMKRVARELTETAVEREFRHARPIVSSIPGWLYKEQEEWLFKAASRLPHECNIVEIGSFKGRSTSCLAFGCRASKKRVFAVDTFNGNEWDFADRNFFAEFSENLDRCGLSKHVVPIVGLSGEIAKSWKEPIHLLFIDGSHRYEDVVTDFFGFFPHVVPGGTVALHDVNGANGDWPDVFRVWDEIVRHQLVEIGFCKNLAFGRKPSAGLRAKT